MAKRMLLDRQRAIPTTEVPLVSAGRTESEADPSDRSTQLSGTADELPFVILEETIKSFRKFNATGRTFLIKFNSAVEEQEPTSYLRERITGLTNYLVEVPDTDTVGLTICNTEDVEIKWSGLA
jgi:hypothetical protein